MKPCNRANDKCSQYPTTCGIAVAGNSHKAFEGNCRTLSRSVRFKIGQRHSLEQREGARRNTPAIVTDMKGYGGGIPLKINFPNRTVSKTDAPGKAETPEFLKPDKTELPQQYAGMVPEAKLQSHIDAATGAPHSSHTATETMKRGMQQALNLHTVSGYQPHFPVRFSDRKTIFACAPVRLASATEREHDCPAFEDGRVIPERKTHDGAPFHPEGSVDQTRKACGSPPAASTKLTIPGSNSNPPISASKYSSP